MTELITRRNANTRKFEDLESQAAMMMLINQGDTIKNRRISVPKQIKGNQNHTFGIKSKGNQKHIAPSTHGSDTESQMKSIMQHTENLRDSLERKIATKMRLDEIRKRQHKTVMEKIAGTKASELRSQSALANKALHEIGDGLELLRKQKGFRNDASFADIEKQKHRLDRAFLLPPIEKVKSLNKSLLPSYSSSPYHLAQIAYGRQSQPQLQKRIDKLGLGAPVLASKKNAESTQIKTQKETSDVLLQKRSLELLNSMTTNKASRKDAKIYSD